MRLTKAMSKQTTKGLYIVLLIKDTDDECHDHEHRDLNETQNSFETKSVKTRDNIFRSKC